MALLPQPPDLLSSPSDKIQHVLAFFTLGVLAAAGWRAARWLTLFAGLAAFGGAIEVLQTIPALHRHGEPIDWLADMVAAAAAIGLTRLTLPRMDG